MTGERRCQYAKAWDGWDAELAKSNYPVIRLIATGWADTPWAASGGMYVTEYSSFLSGIQEKVILITRPHSLRKRDIGRVQAQLM